jgi:hypothetical protein
MLNAVQSCFEFNIHNSPCRYPLQMDPLRELTAMSPSEMQSGWNSTGVAGPSYVTQPNSSRATELEGHLSSNRHPVQNSGRITMGSSSSPSQSQCLLPGPSGRNIHPGFFEGSSNVDARNGTFNNVGRDQYNYYNVETKVCS